MTSTARKLSSSEIIWILLAVIVVFTYFFGLGLPLLGPDEPRYTQIAREMFERGDWITPKLGGFDWFEKPALLYWLQIAAFKLFGVSEFTARIGSALFGLGTVFSVWLIGRSEEKQVGILGFARIAAIAAATSIGMIAFSRAASFDIILTFPITAALAAIFIYFRSDERSNTSLTVFYFFVGVALIGKGLVGIVFPYAIVTFFLLLSWRFPSKKFILSLFWGTILAAIVAAVWYVPMYQVNGWKFIDEFFIQHHFQRYTSNKYQHPQPFWFFFAVLPAMTLPWLPFFLKGTWDALKGIRNADKNSYKLSTFAFAWMLVPLVFFSVSGSKLPGYILPSLPSALILAGLAAHKFIGLSEIKAKSFQFVATAVLMFSVVLVQFGVLRFAPSETTKFMIESASAKGFGNTKIVNLYAVTHNLEFYAPGRIVRDDEGKIKRYDDFSLLKVDFANENILVVFPKKDAEYLQKNNSPNFQVLADNTDHAIAVLKP